MSRTRSFGAAVGSAKRAYWRARYASWQRSAARVRDGYTVLVPVPGDLPVMADLALWVLSRQAADHRIATFVVPDAPSTAVDAVVQRHCRDWPGELRRIELRPLERQVLPRLGDPGKNHAAQLVRGIESADSSHVIFHDADLLALDAQLHESLWTACTRPDVDVTGVDSAWDPWFAERDRRLVATWEMCVRTSWLRRFPPWRHFAHEARVGSEDHVFDTTFWPQWQTAQDRLDVVDAAQRFVHFNYVISTYRHYGRATAPFHDDSFRLLILRLLVDLYDTTDYPYELPTMVQLARGLSDASQPVFYRPDDAARYRGMRDKLRAFVAGSPPSARLAEVTAQLAVFDAWQADCAASAREGAS